MFSKCCFKYLWWATTPQMMEGMRIEGKKRAKMESRRSEMGVEKGLRRSQSALTCGSPGAFSTMNQSGQHLPLFNAPPQPDMLHLRIALLAAPWRIAPPPLCIVHCAALGSSGLLEAFLGPLTLSQLDRIKIPCLNCLRHASVSCAISPLKWFWSSTLSALCSTRRTDIH